MGIPTGDFIGFSFNGIHSTELGICRTSDGNRYNDTFLPTAQDKTVQVPGGDGTYLFGTYFTQKPFSIPIAFDSLTEEQYQRIRTVFGDRKVHELIFDERPYKVYYVKTTGNPQLKTICFDEDGQRIYKGEGTITFTAFYPYAKSKHKFIEDYYNDGCQNIDEWAAASGLQENRSFVTEDNNTEYFAEEKHYEKSGSGKLAYYNTGDMDTDFVLDIAFSGLPEQRKINKGSTTSIFTSDYYELISESNDLKLKIIDKTKILDLANALANQFSAVSGQPSGSTPDQLKRAVLQNLYTDHYETGSGWNEEGLSTFFEGYSVYSLFLFESYLKELISKCEIYESSAWSLEETNTSILEQIENMYINIQNSNELGIPTIRNNDNFSTLTWKTLTKIIVIYRDKYKKKRLEAKTKRGKAICDENITSAEKLLNRITNWNVNTRPIDALAGYAANFKNTFMKDFFSSYKSETYGQLNLKELQKFDVFNFLHGQGNESFTIDSIEKEFIYSIYLTATDSSLPDSSPNAAITYGWPDEPASIMTLLAAEGSKKFADQFFISFRNHTIGLLYSKLVDMSSILNEILDSLEKCLKNKQDKLLTDNSPNTLDFHFEDEEPNIMLEVNMQIPTIIGDLFKIEDYIGEKVGYKVDYNKDYYSLKYITSSEDKKNFSNSTMIFTEEVFNSQLFFTFKIKITQEGFSSEDGALSTEEEIVTIAYSEGSPIFKLNLSRFDHCIKLEDSKTKKHLNFKINIGEDDIYSLRIDTKNKLLLLCKYNGQNFELAKNGKDFVFLNKYIIGGDFFKLTKDTQLGYITLNHILYDKKDNQWKELEEPFTLKGYKLDYSLLYY